MALGIALSLVTQPPVVSQGGGGGGEPGDLSNDTTLADLSFDGINIDVVGIDPQSLYLLLPWGYSGQPTSSYVIVATTTHPNAIFGEVSFSAGVLPAEMYFSVTAEDGETIQEYTVLLEVESQPE